MARAIWSGAISFGLVNVPVKAYSASHDHEVHFNQLDKKSGSRISYKKVSQKSGREVEADDIELGYELSKGHYVTVDPDELEQLRPKSTKTIDVGDFVALAEIDPIYYEKTYWLAPDGEAATRPYRLLLEAMEQQQRVAIGAVVMRRKEYLAAIRPLDGALALSTMRFADEIVDKATIDEIPTRGAKPDRKELALATQIIDALASDWQPEKYHDTYTEELRDIIRRRSEGEEIEIEATPASSDNVLDLMEALQRSVDAAKRARKGGAGKAIEKAADALADELADDADDDEDHGAASTTKTAAARGAKKAGPAKRANRPKRAAKKAPAKRPARKSA